MKFMKFAKGNLMQREVFFTQVFNSCEIENLFKKCVLDDHFSKGLYLMTVFFLQDVYRN